MNTARKTFDCNYNDLLLFVSTYLPDNWCIELRVVKGEATMRLYGPHGILLDPHADGDAVDYWLDHVNYAREGENMEKLTWEDYCWVRGGD